MAVSSVMAGFFETNGAAGCYNMRDVDETSLQPEITRK